MKGPPSTCVWSVGHRIEASMADVDRAKHEMSSNLGLPRVHMLDQTTAKSDVTARESER